MSTGDEIEVPDVTGRPYADAVAELEPMGLSVEVEGADPDDDDFAVGEVIRTDPEAATRSSPGDTVP